MPGLRQMLRYCHGPTLDYVEVSLKGDSAQQMVNSRHSLVEYTQILIIKASSMRKAEDVDPVARTWSAHISWLFYHHVHPNLLDGNNDMRLSPLHPVVWKLVRNVDTTGGPYDCER